MRDLHLLTDKPVMYVCNVGEREANSENSYMKKVKEIAARENAVVAVISAAVEAEVSELPASERAEFLRGLGLQESGLDQLIHKGYRLLDLITFFTAGPKEVRAWTVRRGTAAPQAAGTIHTDFEKGFIRAEIMKFADLSRLRSEGAVKEAGLFSVEGKDYVIADGDVAHFRFNV